MRGGCGLTASPTKPPIRAGHVGENVKNSDIL